MKGKRAGLVAHGDVLRGLGLDLLAEHGVEEVGVGELLSRGLLEQRFEAITGLEQAKPLEVLVDALELDGVHRPASMSASWTAKSADFDVGGAR